MTKVRMEGPLVGMRFRPPAEDVVNMLPAGAELMLQRQPENQYDMNAIQVFLPGFSKGGAQEKLFMQFKNDALDGEDAERLTDPLFLGFVANSEKTGGKAADLIAPQMDGSGLLRVKAKLIFNPRGLPMIETELEPVEDDGLEEETCSECGEPIDDCICEDEEEFDPPQLDRDRFPQE